MIGRQAWVGLATWLGAATAFGGDGTISFNRDVRPILSEHCYACHGPDAGARKAGDVKIRFADDAVDATVGGTRRRRRRQNEGDGEFEQISMEGLEDSE